MGGFAGYGRGMDAPITLPGLTSVISFDARRQARALYWRGWDIVEIARELGLVRNTVQSWKDRDKWHLASPITRASECIYTRYQTLIDKDKKTGSDFKEIDLLGRQLERMARVEKYQGKDGHEGDLNPAISERGRKARAAQEGKNKKNHFSEEQCAELKALFLAELFDYQRGWLDSSAMRTRMILKSRQIGATWYFAREALIDAIETGRNQIFLSASKAQAHIFRNYIVQFAARVGVKLTGDPMVITSDLIPEGEPAAELHFLGTNARTAQGYHGNFYFDEFMWVYGFTELYKVARNMAAHKRWRRTMFSTPSSIAHEGHAAWSGELINRGRKKADLIKIDVSHGALEDGQLGADGVWRQIVTLSDAEAGGCDLFDHDEIRVEHSPEEYANLFDCQFVDDSLSAFKFNQLLACMCDSWVDWAKWFDPMSRRPVKALKVWAGYDPQESDEGDHAALVVGVPPSEPGGKFRLLEKHQLRGMDFEEQDRFIRSVLSKYNLDYFGIDATGVGAGVYQLVKKWYPRVTKIEYTLEVKSALVMKAQNIIARGRLEMDAGWTDVAQAFLSIKKTMTPSGRNMTFKAGRGGATGHADLAWAIMHILINEPLDGLPRDTGSIEIFNSDDEGALGHDSSSYGGASTRAQITGQNPRQGELRMGRPRTRRVAPRPARHGRKPMERTLARTTRAARSLGPRHAGQPAPFQRLVPQTQSARRQF